MLYINTAILYDVRLKEDVAYFFCTVKINLHYIWRRKYFYTMQRASFASDSLRRRYIIFLALLTKIKSTRMDAIELFLLWKVLAWDLRYIYNNLICYYWYWFVDCYLMLICYYYNTVHGCLFYLERVRGCINLCRGAKKMGGGGMTLRGVILYMMIINLSLPASAAGQTASTE